MLGYDVHAEHYPLLRDIVETSKQPTLRRAALRLLAADSGSRALMRRIATDRGEDKDARATAAVALQSLAPKDFDKVARSVVLDDDDDDDVRATVISAITHGPTTPSRDVERKVRADRRRTRRHASAQSRGPRLHHVAVHAPHPAVMDIDTLVAERPGRPLASRRAAAAPPRGAPGVRRARRVRRAAHPGLGDGRVRDGRPAPEAVPAVLETLTTALDAFSVAAAARAARGDVAPDPALAGALVAALVRMRGRDDSVSFSGLAAAVAGPGRHHGAHRGAAHPPGASGRRPTACTPTCWRYAGSTP